ncbi:hypothetical protein ABE057_20325 [Bacillus paralicheniformis]|uniref:hypothetical protein n=1 Tax=Bacillus paralicheniformis TaxID=1648923 RepID=UPI003D1B931C
MKKADLKKNLPPSGGILDFWFLVLKKPAIQPVFCDFGVAKIGSFLILILYRNNKIFENGSQPLSVKGLGHF